MSAQTTPFIGREHEITALMALLENPDCRLLTLVGPGGIGKTRLALEVVSLYSDTYSEGVIVVELAAIEKIEELPNAIAREIGIELGQGDDQIDRLAGYLSNRVALFLLDNYEHLLPNLDLVQAIIDRAPNIQLLVTSREVLNLRTEIVFPLGGLDFPAKVDRTSSLLNYDAIALFIERARYANAQFSPEDEAEHIIQITQLVEGMPLALEHAASWLRTLSCTAIVSELKRGFDVLSTTSRDVMDRHRMMRTVFDSSWRLLTDDQRVAFARMSVFQNGFEREAGEQVAGASLPMLASLVDKSFVQRDPSDRFRLHPLMRQYAAERLDEMGEATATRDAHCAYFTDFMAEREADIKGRRQVEGLHEIDTDYENVIIAWEWALEHLDLDTLDHMLETLYEFTRLWRNSRSSATVLYRAMSHIDTALDDDGHPILGRVLARCGDLKGFLGISREGAPLLERALAIAEWHNNSAEIAFCQWIIVMQNYKGDIRERRHFVEQSLAYYQGVADRYNIARLLSTKAALADWNHPDQYEVSDQLISQSLMLRQEIGDQIGMAWSIRGQSALLNFSGKHHEAEHLLRESSRINQAAGIRRDVFDKVNSFVAFQKGDFERAKILEENRLEASLASEVPSTTFGCYTFLAGITAIEGNYTLAQHYLQQCHTVKSVVAHDVIQYRRAQVFVACGQGDLSFARKELTHPIIREWLATVKPGFALLLCLSWTILILAEDRKLQYAVELLALAHSFPKIISGWLDQWVLLNQLRTNLEHELGSEVYAAAWNRGQQRDWRTTVDEILAYFPVEENDASPNQSLIDPLTPRELEVLALLAKGLTNPQIAERLFITTGTVRGYTHQIYQKLNVANRTQAAAHAQTLGLIPSSNP